RLDEDGGQAAPDDDVSDVLPCRSGPEDDDVIRALCCGHAPHPGRCAGLAAMPVDPREFAAALAQYAAGVCLLTVRDGIDDVGTTVTSVMSVSADPPLVAVGLTARGYPAEVLEEVGRCGLTVLGAQHAIVASRFSS